MRPEEDKILYFKEIRDFAKVCKFDFALKDPGFLIYNYDQVSADSWINLSAYRQNYFEICLEITRGCSFTIDQFVFPAVENRLSFVSPHRLHSMEAHLENQKTFKGFTLFFTSDFIDSRTINGEFLWDFPFFNPFNSPFISLPVEAMADFIEVFNKIHREYQKYDAFSKDLILHYLQVLFIMGKRHYRGALHSLQAVTREQEIYNAFDQLLQKHFLELTSVKDYADRLYVTPKHLSETIKKVGGKSALQLIHQAQVNYAKTLLLQTGMSITQIAAELKFDSLDYFSVFFKQHTGLSPLKFRISNKNSRLF